MKSILAGVETEYGLLVEGRGAEDQVEDSAALVRGYPDECFVGWDYRFESPRADLRGFQVRSLAYDPEDAKFDAGKNHGSSIEVRSDRILPNGARFYNDHGHPEYSTPECLSIFELARHDCAGQGVVLRAAAAMRERTGLDVRVYKNNTDFHGASYGTHENYLVRRELGFQKLYDALAPMLIVRQILVGAGKVGSESGKGVKYQLSQRADFFTEPANVETLFRRPIFNTRDEPHSNPEQWIRVHVIAGDANMIPAATARKVGLAKLALHLAEIGEAPVWKIARPVQTFQEISRDDRHEFRIELDGRSWTTGYEMLESYFAAAERCLDLDVELKWVIESSRQLLVDLKCDPKRFRQEVDWAAKRYILEQFMGEEGSEWNEAALRSYDLEYHNPDPEEGLHSALVQMGEVEPDPDEQTLQDRRERVFENCRSFARSLAVQNFRSSLLSATWGALTFRHDDGRTEDVPLPPDADYPAQLAEASDVGTFITLLRGVQ